jgi:hypothetical protein
MVAGIRNDDVTRGSEARSISVATEASIEENISFGAVSSGFDSDTTMSRTYDGIAPPSRHEVASA